MYVTLPVYKLLIDDGDESGVDFVALVDRPAIETNWMAFNANLQFKADPNRRIVSGPVMIADLPIYRRDGDKEYYVVFDKATIEKIALKFHKNGFGANANLMHDTPVDGVFLFESFLIDESRGISTPEGFSKLTEGSWFASYKIDNNHVWDSVKAGRFKGFSVEGVFKPKLVKSVDEEVIDRLKGLVLGS